MGRVVLPGEPWFLEEDTEDVFEFLAMEDARCPGCGHDKRRSFSKESIDRYTVKKHYCYSCEARDRASANHDGERHGLFFVTIDDDE